MYSLGATLYSCMTEKDPPTAIARAHDFMKEGRSPILPGLEDSKGYSSVLKLATEELMQVSYLDRIQCVAALREAIHLLLTPPDPGRVDRKGFNLELTEGQVWSDRLIDGRTGPALVLVPAGEFVMGRDEDSDTAPAHPVKIQNPFGIGIYPITEAEFEEMVTDIGDDSALFFAEVVNQ